MREQTMWIGTKCIAVALTAALLLFASLPAQAADFVVEVNKGKLMRLKEAAASVIIADPTIADVQVISPMLIYVNGKRTGETSVFAVDKNNNQILDTTVSVTHNLSKLNSSLKKMLPGANVNFNTVDGALVLNGSAESPLQVDDITRLATPFLKTNENLVNLMSTKGTDQVMLKVRVAEVSRNELKRFGINLESLLNAGNFLFGVAQGRDIVNAAGTITRAGSDNSIVTRYTSDDADITGVIDALESDGLITILAEPSLTTSSGKPASFLAGGEFPVPVVGEEQSVTIEYRPYGVSLNFTPTVLSRDKISLNVAPEVSTLSSIGQITAAGFNIPSLITRRASTTVELGSGQTFAVAGLLQNNKSNDIDKFPGLGDLPVLGLLFRSSEFRQDQTELVILVTPYIVTAAPSEASMKTPVDDLRPASDKERVLHGQLFHENAPAKTSDKQSATPTLHGPGGYMLQ